MLLSKNLSFLLIISFIVITSPLKFIVKNKLNEDNFDIEHIKNTLKKININL